MNLDAFLERADAARVAGVSTAVVGQWRARGWLDRSGTRRHLTVKPGAGGRLQYRLGDVLDAERDTRANPRSHRGLNLDAAEGAG